MVLGAHSPSHAFIPPVTPSLQSSPHSEAPKEEHSAQIISAVVRAIVPRQFSGCTSTILAYCMHCLPDLAPSNFAFFPQTESSLFTGPACAADENHLGTDQSADSAQQLLIELAVSIAFCKRVSRHWRCCSHILLRYKTRGNWRTCYFKMVSCKIMFLMLNRRLINTLEHSPLLMQDFFSSPAESQKHSIPGVARLRPSNLSCAVASNTSVEGILALFSCTLSLRWGQLDVR